VEDRGGAGGEFGAGQHTARGVQQVTARKAAAAGDVAAAAVAGGRGAVETAGRQGAHTSTTSATRSGSPAPTASVSCGDLRRKVG
jgi:hypothetical protein